MENTMTASLNGIKGIEINRDFVLKNCRIKTVSVSMNIGKLDNVPKRYRCDLAELVVIQLDVNGEAAMGVVNNDLMKSAGIEEDELFETARRNTVEKFVFLDFADVMGLFTETEHIMYMVTNEDCIYGAAAIMFPEYLKDVRERLGEDFYILPSSVHEIIVVRKSVGSPEELRELVRCVNGNPGVIKSSEILSNNVYEIDEDGNLKIAK